VLAPSIYIDVTKNKDSVVQQLIMHAELRGRSEVSWSSSCGMMSWVAGNSSGILRPKAPVATFSVLLNATGRLDYSNAAETPTASLMLQTSYVDGPANSPPRVERVEHARSLRIHMKVLSEAYVLREDVTIMAIESGLWLSLKTFALPEDGDPLPLLWGRSLRFQVAHFFPWADLPPSKRDDFQACAKSARFRFEISTGFLFAANRTCISRSLGLRGRFDWHKWLRLASSFLVLLRVTTSASALRSHTMYPFSTTESSPLSSTSFSASLL
jgi:hypothetical protein